MIKFKWNQNTIIRSIIDNKYFPYFLFLAVICKIKQHKPFSFHVTEINKIEDTEMPFNVNLPIISAISASADCVLRCHCTIQQSCIALLLQYYRSARQVCHHAD